MTRNELIRALRVTEAALWKAGNLLRDAAPDVLDAQQEVARILRAVDSSEKCQRCGCALVQTGLGRPKRYCSDNCRKYAYAEKRQTG
ncbi:hypothetical protein OG243_26620 [Streptomyces sp. NBC_01318]|uniref:hypothetical protein n=1 Tax=Streptomyces sp. NBC_01318 TaxID=2903823 RepID=UPI002E14625B|nr:hypothetical protein OG243_26620 [Streptomyces sp. NBC_01318]